jgi:NTP pyrophosphatase (non-canonical NTP hydrolase)
MLEGDALSGRYDFLMDIDALQKQLANFATERDWEQFHSPKNLAMALAAEAGELLEVFQWLSEEQSGQLSGKERTAAEHEIADVFIYLLRLADGLKIDLNAAVVAKMQLNAEKYPVALARGNAVKADRRD